MLKAHRLLEYIPGIIRTNKRRPTAAISTINRIRTYFESFKYVNSSCISEAVTPESDHVAYILLQIDSACLIIPPIRLRTPTTMRTGYVLNLIPDVLRHPHEHLLDVEGFHGW